ncbi:GvpL/GvpF family gas vesicle protein [Plantactinospora siamensis]|uniref:GvpL/GvpF family gas vesicle protein n=1 Tax=Plantactinospora siamensis TaxID=555372 RepID=A0ABV6NWE1_9ACTN
MAEQDTGLLVYGIVPSDVEPTADARGVGDPPAEVTVIEEDGLAALVSPVPLDQPLGRPADLAAYKELLDGTAQVAPVLPVRFGTVVTRPKAVTELLAGHHDAFLDELAELEGLAQFVVHARYVERAVISQILESNREAGQLRDQIHGQPQDAVRGQRIRLGEILSQAVELRREQDTAHLVEALTETTVSHLVRPPSHEQDAAYVAFLVELDREGEFEEALRGVAEEWAGLANVRLLGPLAAYDFVDQQRLRS